MKRGKGVVFVGLSGGVDSSVSAKRLLNDGFSVVGVFIKTWVPDFLDCNIENERLDAMRVAATLNIPFKTLDAEEEYRTGVAEYMIREYEGGRTPNPDVMCNREVKFGAFLRYAMREGADFIATGHYASLKREGAAVHLERGTDPEKDQSYFLWTLTQAELQKTLFPIGDSHKSAVRDEASRYSLPTARKSDSQGICFLGHVDMKEFLSHYVHAVPGNVIDESGNVIGTHSGALFYTLGQRAGFSARTTDDKSSAHYVIAKDMEANTITVAPSPCNMMGNRIQVTDVNVISEDLGDACEAQFRYRQKPFNVAVERDDDGHVMLTMLTEGIETPSLGQSCVFYRGNRCLGGGIINQIL